MSWFNYYGLIFVAVLLVPNIVYAIKNKGDRPAYNDKIVSILENVGRYACMMLMVFNIPYVCFGFFFPYAEVVYLTVDSVLVFSYCVCWAVFWEKEGLKKALFLSILPSLLFLFSGILLLNVPLIVFAVLFSVAHILISVKNVQK